MTDWLDDIEMEYEEIPGLSYDPDGISNQELDSMIAKAFGQTEPHGQREALDTVEEITLEFSLTKPEKPAKIQAQKEKGKIAPEKEKKEMAAKTATPKVRKLRKGQVKEVTPFGRRGRPSQEMLALRQAELAAGYVLPVKNHNPEGQRGRPRLFARISVSDLARANEALTAAGQPVISL